VTVSESTGAPTTEPTPRTPRYWAAGALNSYPIAILAYLATRAFLIISLAGFGPYRLAHRAIPDVYKYADWARLIDSTGGLPATDPSWQYPPLAGVLFWLTGQSGLPTVGTFIALAAAADLAIFLMLLLSGRGRRPNVAAWAYTGLGLLVGPVLLARFDVITAVPVVAALIWIHRPWLSGALLGIGASLKVWPILVLLSVPRRALARSAAAAIAVVVVVNATLFGLLPNAGSFLEGEAERGVQVESVPAAGFVTARLFGAPVQVKTRYGSAEIIAHGTEIAALVATVIGLVVLALIAYFRLRGRLEGVEPADVALAVVLVAIATSRVFSPQYMVWAVAIAACCLLSTKTVMRPVIVVCAIVCVLGQLTYPLTYAGLREGELLGSTLQLARIVTLLVATGWALTLLLRHRPSVSDPGVNPGGFPEGALPGDG